MPGRDLDEQIGLLGDARALGIDNDQPGTTLLSRRLNFPREMQVGHRDVVAPDHDEIGVADLLGRHPGRGAVEARVGRPSDDPAELSAGEQRRPEPVEEPAVHRAARELAVGACVVQRQHRLRAVPRNGVGDAGMDLVEGLVPGDRLEGVPAAGSHPLQRAGEPPGAVHELGVGARDLVANHPGRVRIGLRAAHVEDADPVGPDRKAARVRAIQRADAGSCAGDIGGDHGETSSCWTTSPAGGCTSSRGRADLAIGIEARTAKKNDGADSFDGTPDLIRFARPSSRQARTSRRPGRRSCRRRATGEGRPELPATRRRGSSTTPCRG